jgi:preprotein translocase subunit YajC
MNTLIIFAQAPQQGGMGAMLIPMALVFGIFYFMMIRPQQRKEKERQRMIAELRAGQRIAFAGGLTGTIAEAKEATFMVEIAPKVVIEIARSSVSQVLTEDGTIEVERR